MAPFLRQSTPLEPKQEPAERHETTLALCGEPGRCFPQLRSGGPGTGAGIGFLVLNWVIDLKNHLDPPAWVLSGKINAMENCAHCNWGLTTLSGEVNVRVIVLFSLFDRTQGRVRV